MNGTTSGGFARVAHSQSYALRRQSSAWHSVCRPRRDFAQQGNARQAKRKHCSTELTRRNKVRATRGKAERRHCAAMHSGRAQPNAAPALRYAAPIRAGIAGRPIPQRRQSTSLPRGGNALMDWHSSGIAWPCLPTLRACTAWHGTPERSPGRGGAIPGQAGRRHCLARLGKDQRRQSMAAPGSAWALHSEPALCTGIALRIMAARTHGHGCTRH